MTEDVQRWDATACERGVRQLIGLAEDLDRAYRRLDAAHAALGSWRGSAADRALPRVRSLTVRVSELTGLVRLAADAIRSGLQGIAEAAELATVPAQSPAEAAEARAVAISVDGRVAAGLAVVVAPPAAPVPDRGSTPAEVADWWAALPPHLRDRLLERQPALLGGLTGLPAGARDQANRRQLATLLPQLRADRKRVLATVPPVPIQLARAAVLRSMLAVAEGVERTLARLDVRRPPARLLTLDLAGSGRVAIALGDVDRARHVAVLVPGMGQDATRGVPGAVDRAVDLLTEAGRQSAESTAVVAWVGYSAPGWQQVPFPARARSGGQLLAADLAALDAARAGQAEDPAHVTLIGHSYGSTVVGAAMQSGPRRAGDLVLVGSPGVLAENVSRLGMPGRRVWVEETALDPVADLGAFGTDPGDRGFGATRMRTDPRPGLSPAEQLLRAHSRYFDPGSESLRNIARVVVGHDSDVTRLRAAA
jgi:pimeloyl-ACP methyl ester carboxylesterase